MGIVVKTDLTNQRQAFVEEYVRSNKNLESEKSFEMDILSAGRTLLLIMDPLGNIPVFLTVLKNVESESRKRKIWIRELAIALLVLLVFLFISQYLLQLLNLRQEAVHIAGGIVLFLIALRMIFYHRKENYGRLARRRTVYCHVSSSIAGWPFHTGNAYFTCQISAR